jgi:hypothetical protein
MGAVTRLAPYGIAAALALMLSASLYGWGHRAGRIAAEARTAEALAILQARYDAQAEAARKLEIARLQTERRLTDALAELSDAALADPDAGRHSLGPASVQRLGRIGRAD